jgi:sigma-E factor negative regulatory protein RseC
MLEARAVVIALDGQDAVVEAQQSAGCGHCSSAGGCGTAKLSKLFSSGARQFRVRNSIAARVGETVKITVADGVLLKSSMLLYALPIALLLVGGVIGTGFSADAALRDAYAAGGALAGLLLGFVAARLLAGKLTGSDGVQLVMSRDMGCQSNR